MHLKSSGVFALSLLVLGCCVLYFFLFPRPVSFEESEEDKAEKVTILLEGAEVAKVTERGKEWVLRAPRIEKQEGTVMLSSISGVFFSGGNPLYEVRAGSGEVLLETSTVTLEDVELHHVETGEFLSGKRLTWKGTEHTFALEGVRFRGKQFAARCDILIYNVARKRATFQGDVVVELEMKVP